MNSYLCSRRYKRSVFLVVFALIIQLMTGTTVKAEDSPQYVGRMEVNLTNVSISNDKDEEVGTDGNPIKQGSTVSVRYEMELTNCTELTTSQALHITFPEQLKLIQDEDINLMVTIEGKGEVQVGTCQLMKDDGIGMITFNEVLQTYDKAILGFEVGVKVEVSINPGEEEEIKIPFKVGGQTIEAILVFEGEDKPEEEVVPASIAKQCEIIDEANNQIIWVITVKAGSNPLKGAQLIESFKKDELTISSAYTKEENDIEKKVEFVSKDSNDEIVTKLVHDIPDLEAEEEYIVYIVTDIGEDVYKVDQATESTGIIKMITNKASLQYNVNGEAVTKDDSAEAKIKFNMITKEVLGKTDKEGIREIEWKVTINGNRRNLTGYMLVDKIPEGLELENHTVKLQWKDDSGTSYSIVPSYNYEEKKSSETIYSQQDNKDITVNFIGEMSYEFPDDAGNYEYTLTYTTKVTDDTILDSNNIAKFYNYVQLSGPGIGEGINVHYDFTGVGFTTSMVKKEGTYNRTNHTITWQVTINNNKLALKKGEVSDNIPNGLSFVAGSVRVAQGAKALSSSDSNFTTVGSESTPLEGNVSAFYDYDTPNKLLECRLVGNFSVPYTIRFDTTVDDYNIYAGNNTLKEFTNAVCFNGVKQQDGIALPESSAESTVKVTSKILEKKSTYYNYKTREVTWLIIVNQNGMEIPDAKVTDIIPSNQNYVEGSLKLIEGSLIYKNNGYQLNGTSYTEETLPNLANSSRLDIQKVADGSQVMNYNLGAIDKTYTMLIKTQIDQTALDEVFAVSGSTTVRNTAAFSGAIIPSEVKVTADITIKNQSIYKKGIQEKKDEPIKWEIIINQNQLKIDNAVITDKLSSGLELDTDTIQLYKMDVDESGNVIESSEEKVSFNPRNVGYDRASNIFTFSFEEPIFNCYRLTFSTNVTDSKPQKSYTNKAYFEGDQIKKENNGSEQVKVETQFSKSWGSVFKKRGKVEITKVDSETGKLLEGAIFNLLDRNGVILETSGGSSTVTFSELIVGREYEIEEVKAPDGYKKQTDNYKFTVADADILKIQIKNEKLKSGVQFTKVDAKHNPLAGAAFMLYSSDKTQKWIAKSDEVGTVTFENIPVGNYLLTEVAAPEGYYCTNIIYEVSIKTESPSTIILQGSHEKVNITEIINLKKKGKITVKKVNEKNEVLKGAEITLLNSNKEIIKVVETNEEGLAYFDNLTYGTYYIKETRAPQGYDLDETLNTVNINGDDITFRLVNKATIPNPPNPSDDDTGSILVTKVNENSQLLEGAEITLLNSNKEVVKVLVTDRDGEAYFSELPYGIYYIQETESPSGYVLDKTLHRITVNGNRETLTLVNKQSSSHKDDDNDDDDEPNPSSPSSKPDNHKPSNQTPDATPSPSPSETPEVPSGQPAPTLQPIPEEQSAGHPIPESKPNGEPLPKTGNKSQADVITLISGLFICLGSGVITYNNKKKSLGKK